MKKILCTALAACILLGGVLALPAFAETPAAIPADHEPRVLNELSGNAAFMRNLKAMLTKTATPFRVKSAKTKSPADAVGAAPAEGAVATLQLCTSFHPSEAPVNVDGHAFFIVTNVSDADLDVGGLLIAPGTAMTIGNRANRDEHGGLWYNLEGFYNYYIDDYYPDAQHAGVAEPGAAGRLQCGTAQLRQVVRRVQLRGLHHRHLERRVRGQAVPGAAHPRGADPQHVRLRGQGDRTPGDPLRLCGLLRLPGHPQPGLPVSSFPKIPGRTAFVRPFCFFLVYISCNFGGGGVS